MEKKSKGVDITVFSCASLHCCYWIWVVHLIGLISVTGFWGHVACSFYPLEGLSYDNSSLIVSTNWYTQEYFIACVAGGISRASAFVLVAKPRTRVAKPWEDWWRVELNSRLPKFVGFFELCVHQCTRISDWLRGLKRQSNVNLYLSSFPGEKVCFHTQICKMDNAKKCIEEALDSLNIRRESGKIILKEEQERAVKELISGNDV